MPAASIPTRPSLWSELFTASGRTNRGRYWLTLAALLVPFLLIAFFAGILLAALQIPGLPVLGTIILGILYLALVVPALLVTIRRLHDRDKSGHWLWLFYLLPAVLNGAGRAMEMQNSSGAALLLSLIGFGISVWAFVEIGCL